MIIKLYKRKGFIYIIRRSDIKKKFKEKHYYFRHLIFEFLHSVLFSLKLHKMLTKLLSAAGVTSNLRCHRNVILFCLFFRAAPVAYGRFQAKVEWELQLLAYTTATAMPDLSHIWDRDSLRQSQILNPLREARDWTHVLMDPSWVHYHWATRGTPALAFFFLNPFCHCIFWLEN